MPLLPHGSSLLVQPRAEDAQGLPRGCSTAAPHQQAHSRMVAQLSPSSCQDLSPSITSLVASGPLAGARGTTIPPQQKWHHGSCSRLCVGLQHCSDRFFHYFLLGCSLSAFPCQSHHLTSPHPCAVLLPGTWRENGNTRISACLEAGTRVQDSLIQTPN